MTVCPQNFAVFPLSIRENIGIGEVEDIENIPAILQAVRKGGAEDVIRLHGLDKILSGIGEPNQMGWDEPEQPAPPRNEANADSKSESKKTETEKTEPSSALESDKRPEDIQEEKVATEKDNKQPRNPWDSEIPPTISLSGGQMQRVALSRAFMRADKATLVVLDTLILTYPDISEPSSSLDARAEYELFQRIYALSRGESEETRTTIYISHRFSTVRRADKIAVVEDGAIIELGSHKELMALGGRYAEFFNLQVKAFSE
ncbi:P-loop containing nucleoside triphosphate hydrolase protein [Serendipita vermifera]|nr:P-loop containing nucleoside triphosphate hydrolase protein [Serendipita vermifera]